MARPNVDTAWATVEGLIPVVSKGNTVLVANRLEPTTQVKAEGVRPTVPPSASAINYKLYADHVMIEWLRNTEVGTVLEFENGTMTLIELMDARGGTWEDLGTVSRGYSNGSVTIRGFKKLT